MKREARDRPKGEAAGLGHLTLGRRMDNPAGVTIDAALPRNSVERRHIAVLPYDKIADCIAKVKANKRARRSLKLALEFLVLTAGRSAEVRKVTRKEIDLDGATWTVPAERMKLPSCGVARGDSGRPKNRVAGGNPA